VEIVIDEGINKLILLQVINIPVLAASPLIPLSRDHSRVMSLRISLHDQINK